MCTIRTTDHLYPLYSRRREQSSSEIVKKRKLRLALYWLSNFHLISYLSKTRAAIRGPRCIVSLRQQTNSRLTLNKWAFSWSRRMIFPISVMFVWRLKLKSQTTCNPPANTLVTILLFLHGSGSSAGKHGALSPARVELWSNSTRRWWWFPWIDTIDSETERSCQKRVPSQLLEEAAFFSCDCLV